jgi:hypoxanthine phosphoribosyltransferase
MSGSKLFVGCSKYRRACSKLFSVVEEDMKSLREDRRRVILVVGLHRGGTIPATLLDYHLRNSYSKEHLEVCSTVLQLSLRDSSLDLLKSLEASVENLHNFVRTALNSFLDFRPEDMDLNFKVYFVDDLLDSGQTVNLLDSQLRQGKYFWYQQSKIVCLYDKNCPRGSALQSDISNAAAIDSLKQEGKLLIADESIILQEDTWVDFWYEAV